MSREALVCPRAPPRRDRGPRPCRRVQRRLGRHRRLRRSRVERLERRERQRERERRERREQRRPDRNAVERARAVLVDLPGADRLRRRWQHRLRQRLDQRLLLLLRQQQRRAARGRVQRRDGGWRRRVLRVHGMAFDRKLPVHPVQVREARRRLQLLAAQRRWREPYVVVLTHRGSGLLRHVFGHRQRVPVPHGDELRSGEQAGVELHPREHGLRSRRDGHPRLPLKIRARRGASATPRGGSRPAPRSPRAQLHGSPSPRA